MVKKRTKEICMAFCSPFCNSNGEIIIDNHLSIQELIERMNWKDKNVENYINSLGPGSKYIKVNNNDLFLTTDGKTTAQKGINKFEEKLTHNISHFKQIFNNDLDNKYILDNECKCKSLSKSIKYFPKFQNLIDAIVCFTQLKESVNQNVQFNDIQFFLNNQNIFSEKIIRYFNYLVNNCCGGLRNFFNISICKSIFDISKLNQSIKLKSSLKDRNFRSSDNENKNEIIIQVQMDIFQYLLNKNENKNEISIRELNEILKKNKMNEVNGENDSEVINNILNIKEEFFIKIKNKYIINMKRMNNMKEYDSSKSFISQCLWINPYYKRCLLIICDYLNMLKLLDLKEVNINSVYEWLVNHYSLNKIEKKRIEDFINKECHGLINFIKADINSSVFQIKEDNNENYIILKEELSIDKDKTEIYKQNYLVDIPIILNFYKDNLLSLNYSYISLRNNCELNDIELKIFTTFFISCSKSIKIICNIQNLLYQVRKYNIPIKEESLDYLKKIISEESQIYQQNNANNKNKEIINLSFNSSEKIVVINNSNYQSNSKESFIDEESDSDVYSNSSDNESNIMTIKNNNEGNQLNEGRFYFDNSQGNQNYIMDQPTNITLQNSSNSPLNIPMQNQSKSPMNAPMQMPSKSPMNVPMQNQSKSPMNVPMQNQSISPMNAPMQMPSISPMNVPMQMPSISPMNVPMQNQSISPMNVPMQMPSISPMLSMPPFQTVPHYNLYNNGNNGYNEYEYNAYNLMNEPYSSNGSNSSLSMLNMSNSSTNITKFPMDYSSPLYNNQYPQNSEQNNIEITEYDENNDILDEIKSDLSDEIDNDISLDIIDFIIKKANIEIINDKTEIEIYGEDIILDTVINIIIISSIKILNIHIIPIEVIPDIINKYIYLFPNNGPFDETDIVEYIKYNDKIYKLVNIIDKYFVMFSNNIDGVDDDTIFKTESYFSNGPIIFQNKKFDDNIKILVNSINNSDASRNLKNLEFIPINEYIQYFPIYKDLISDILRILFPESKMRIDLLGSKITSQHKEKSFYYNYYQFLLRSCKGIYLFLTKCSSHKGIFDVKEEKYNNNGQLEKNIYISIYNMYFGNIVYQENIFKILKNIQNDNNNNNIIIGNNAINNNNDNSDNNDLNKNDLSYNDMIRILILNFIISFGDNFYNNNYNKFVFLEEIEQFLNLLFIPITKDEIELLINDKKCENNLCLNTIYENNKERKYVSLNFKKKEYNKKLFTSERFKEYNKSEEIVLSKLLSSLIDVFSNDIEFNHINNANNYFGNYIIFYPFINRLKNYIIAYLVSHGNYDHENNIIKYLKQESLKNEKKIFLYYIACSGGLQNILCNFKDIEIHIFHNIIFYKYTGLSFEKKDNEEIIGNTNMDNDIIRIVKDQLPTENDNQRLEKFKFRITNIITKKWSGLSVHLFGSAVNGLWSNKSDVDLCIFADKPGDYNNMRKLANVLRRGKMENVVPIDRTRIPICKFTDPFTKFNCDLSVNNRIPINNSELLRCYMDLDDRVRDIIMIIKLWSKCRGINNSKQRTFCSYSYVLLCISFFQNIEPPILPNLQDPNAFPELKMVKKRVNVSNRLIYKNKDGEFSLSISYYNNAKEISKYFKCKNSMSRSELLMRLFRFYGYEFQYKDRNVVSSIRTNSGFLTNSSFFKTELAVEDPFIHERNTTSNSTMEEKTHIINEFFRAYNILTQPNSKLEDLFKNDEYINENTQ